jgi:hypothetical protein
VGTSVVAAAAEAEAAVLAIHVARRVTSLGSVPKVLV